MTQLFLRLSVSPSDISREFLLGVFETVCTYEVDLCAHVCVAEADGVREVREGGELDEHDVEACLWVRVCMYVCMCGCM